MNKTKWTFPSSKEVAQEILTQIEKSELVKSLEIVSQITAGIEESKTKEEEIKKEESPGIEEEVKKENKKGKKEKHQNQTSAGGYFININLSENFIENLSMNVLKNGIKLSHIFEKRNVLVDFSSPNIAKEMHVGHLRSTIIGDSICRILEFLGHDVMRINHVGDWGTQFGMLISYLQEAYPNYLNEMPDIKDLEKFYVEAKKRFDDESNPVFKKKAHENTVNLQTGNENCRKAWQMICDISRKEFNKVYQKLNVKLTEVGESFYDKKSRELIPILEEKKILILDKGAKIIRIDNFKQPMIIMKTDGGLTYDTTDLAAIFYRLIDLKRDWIIYVIANEQDAHLKLLFGAAAKCQWTTTKSRLDHMGFGLVLNNKGTKISTKDGGSIKLIDLIDEGKKRAKDEILKKI